MTIDQAAKPGPPVELRIGQIYVLGLSTSSQLLLGWHRKEDQVLSLPPNSLHLRQGGFRIVGRMESRAARIRVLRKGGPLDLYDGRRYRDLVGEFVVSR